MIQNNTSLAKKMATEKKTACVIGGTGYIAGMLVMGLLKKGYAVNTTVRNPDNEKKVSPLRKLQENYKDLKIFKADLTDEGSFNEAITNCHFVFHVATPIHFDSEDPENDMIKPAIQGTLNVLKSVMNAKTVKRVVWTSSAAVLDINKIEGVGHVLDEECWTDVEFLTSEKPPLWGYPVSKALAEKAAWKFAEENKIDLISIVLPKVIGRALTPDVPKSMYFTMALLTGDNDLINRMKVIQMLTGTLPMTHMEDAVESHIFLAEKESASGRYNCCPINIGLVELAKFLKHRYPQYDVPTDFGDFPEEAKLSISSEKLIKAGFKFKYRLEDIYDQFVEHFQTVGLLKK